MRVVLKRNVSRYYYIYILVIIDFLTAFLLIIIMKSRRAFGVLFHLFSLGKNNFEASHNNLAYSIISNRIRDPKASKKRLSTRRKEEEEQQQQHVFFG